MNGGKKYGPLILSEFTGSAGLFQDQLSINPWNYHGHADAIKEALEMSEVEKKRRWTRMHGIVLQQTGGHWAEELSSTLDRAYQEHHQRASTSVPRLSPTQISEKYKQANHRVFIMDYEGTLAPHQTSAGMPLAQPHRFVDTLNDLMSDPKNTVYVTSGLQPSELEGVFRTANGLGLVAENGCFIREYGTGSRDWRTLVDLEQTKEWKADVKAILRYYRERMEGSSIEERYCSLLFKYDKVEDQAAATRQAGDCADQINSGCKSTGVHAVPVSQAVLIECVNVNKSTAATHIFDTLRKKAEARSEEAPDFLMVAGDDREDEVVFRWANGLGKEGLVRDVFTVSIGNRNTEAQAAVTQGSTGLITVLQKLAKISLDQMPVDYFSSSFRQGH